MNKRGQAIQFNWIFVIIAGALILSSLIFFGAKYISLQESRNNALLGRSLDQVFYNAKSTTQFKNFSISSKFDINFECNETIINSEYRQSNDYVLFGSDSVNVNDLIIWSKAFKAPFLADNVIYVFDPNKKIYIENSEMGEKLRAIGLEIVGENEADIFVYSQNNYQEHIGKKVIGVDFTKDETWIYGEMISDSNTYGCVESKLESKWKNLLEIYKFKAENMLGGCEEIKSNLINKLSFDVPLSDDLIEEISGLNRDLANAGCMVIF
jgi:hypothetical protein